MLSQTVLLPDGAQVELSAVYDENTMTLTVNVKAELPAAVEVEALHQIASSTAGPWALSSGQNVYIIDAGLTHEYTGTIKERTEPYAHH